MRTCGEDALARVEAGKSRAPTMQIHVWVGCAHCVSSSELSVAEGLVSAALSRAAEGFFLWRGSEWRAGAGCRLPAGAFLGLPPDSAGADSLGAGLGGAGLGAALVAALVAALAAAALASAGLAAAGLTAAGLAILAGTSLAGAAGLEGGALRDDASRASGLATVAGVFGDLGGADRMRAARPGSLEGAAPWTGQGAGVGQASTTAGTRCKIGRG